MTTVILNLVRMLIGWLHKAERALVCRRLRLQRSQYEKYFDAFSVGREADIAATERVHLELAREERRERLGR